jgi:hypothetical protein
VIPLAFEILMSGLFLAFPDTAHDSVDHKVSCLPGLDFSNDIVVEIEPLHLGPAGAKHFRGPPSPPSRVSKRRRLRSCARGRLT